MSDSLVIPTRFGRDTLPALVDTAAHVGTVILVHTEPGHDDHPDAVNLHDYRRNIHHWWNTGLDACDGPALVLNDDVTATPDALQNMLDELRYADLVYAPGRSRKAMTPITGWCYGVRSERLRPDPAFVWWYGDDDLYQRAQSRRMVPARITHLQRDDMGPAAEFAEAVHADRALYASRWP